MNLLLEVLIQTIVAFLVFIIGYWAFFKYNEDFPELITTHVIIILFLVFFFFLFVNGGRDLVELLKDSEEYIKNDTMEKVETGKDIELDK